MGTEGSPLFSTAHLLGCGFSSKFGALLGFVLNKVRDVHVAGAPLVARLQTQPALQTSTQAQHITVGFVGSWGVTNAAAILPDPTEDWKASR